MCQKERRPVRKLLWITPLLAILAIVGYVGLEVWGGVDRSTSSILRRGERVEVFRIDSKYDKNTTDGICGYKILAVGKEQGTEFAVRLSEVLRRWGVARSSKKCGISPGVVFRIWSGDKAVEVIICFKCDDLKTHLVGTPDDGALTGHLLDFESERADLLALVKEALPDDPVIQALPVKRPEEWVPELPVGSGAVPSVPGTKSDRKQ